MLQTSGTKFDLVLAYPQWQGSGRSENLQRGAQAAAEVCGHFGPLVQIPVAGEGEASGGVNRWTAIIEQFHSAQAILNRRRPQRILTAGGDCACDIAIIDYLNKQYQNLTVIWIDAHLDANSPVTSPSGNFHGMPVAAIMGSAPVDMQALLGKPLASAQFKYVSAHVGDDGDWAFQTDNGLSWFEPHQPIIGPVHVHFDLDSLDPGEFAHVAYSDGKLSIEASLAVVRKVAETGWLVGLTITEFAPSDEAGAEAGSEFIRNLCEAAEGSLS
jgi:arginase